MKIYTLFELSPDGQKIVPIGDSEKFLIIDEDAGMADTHCNPGHWDVDSACNKRALRTPIVPLCPQCGGAGALWVLELELLYYAQHFCVCDKCEIAVHLAGCCS